MNTTNLEALAQEVMLSLDLPEEMRDIARAVVRAELARMHVACGSAEGKPARLAAANAVLAPHGLHVLDLDA